jgi:hypothetical protein
MQTRDRVVAQWESGSTEADWSRMHPENYDPRDRDLAVNLVGSERFRELLEQVRAFA